MFKGIFKDKKIFVTGHTGFQGTWLSLWLKSLGAEVIGYSLEPPTNPSLFEITHIENQITHIIGDVRDQQHLEKSLIKHNPDILFHLAAQPLVRTSYEKPIETFQTNIIGTANLLEGLRNVSSIRVCVIITSDKCYENLELNKLHKESDPLGGFDPYSASKGAAEIITSAYKNSFFNSNNIKKHNTSISTVRAGNVIGGGDWAIDRIVPDCVRSLILKQPISIRNPKAVRPWQYILEAISGMLWLAVRMWEKPLIFGQPWNFGPDSTKNEITVKELVELILFEWGNGTFQNKLNKISKEPHEANFLRLDSTKANNILKWKPVYSIEDTIKNTIDWYKKYYSKSENMNQVTLEKISSYIEYAKKMRLPWTG
jgi:CDP-glucose 4,6-dehydratase